MILILLTVCISCIGCTKEVKIELEEDVNRYDDIYELANGKYLVVDGDSAGITESYASKGFYAIDGFAPQTRPLNPYAIGDYIYISQDLSEQEEYKTKVTKINADTLGIVEEREYPFGFDCMTCDNDELIYAGCKNGEDNFVCVINTDLDERYLASDLKVVTDDTRDIVLDVKKIFDIQFENGKGILTVEAEKNFYKYAFLCTAIIEDEELKICKGFDIVEPNAQIVSVDYDNNKLSFIYNSDGTDPMILLVNKQIEYAEAEQEDMFEPFDFSQEDLTYEAFYLTVQSKRTIDIMGGIVGKDSYSEDRYAQFVENGKWIYYVCFSQRQVSVYRIKKDTWKKKEWGRAVSLDTDEEEVTDLRWNAFVTGGDSLFFHMSDSDGWLASGYIDIGGIWI